MHRRDASRRWQKSLELARVLLPPFLRAVLTTARDARTYI